MYKSTAVESPIGVPSRSSFKLFKFFNLEIDLRIGCRFDDVTAHL